MYHISPSMLCANPLEYRETVSTLNELGIDWFHIDVMDGNFVPNFAIGTDCLKALCGIGEYPFYAHMMTLRPQDFIETFASFGVEYYCFHFETTHNPYRMCQEINKSGMKAAVALNPATPVQVLDGLLPYLSTVTLMAIEPGFSGQAFLPHTYKKIAELKRMVGDLPVLIEVDGGADNEISRNCMQNGCDVIVGGYFSLFEKTHSIEENYSSYMKYISF